MVLADGLYYLFFSGGNWTDPTYARRLRRVRRAVAGRAPSRPTARSSASTVPVVGPGGERAFKDGAGQWWMAYAAWTAGAVGYPVRGPVLADGPACASPPGAKAGPGTPVVPGPTSTPQPLAQQCPTLDPDPAYRLVAADGGAVRLRRSRLRGSGAGQASARRSLAWPPTRPPAATGRWARTGRCYPFDAPA